MKKLLSYLKPYKNQVILAPTFMVFEVLTELIQPLLMASIIDYGISNGDVGYIIRTGAMMIGIVAIGALGGLGSTIFASYVSQNFGADLRTDMFRNIQSFSFNNIDSFKTASLITRLTNDVMLLQNVIQATLRIVLRAPLFSIGGLIIAFTINPRLASIIFFIIPITIVIAALVMRKAFPLFKKVQKRLDKVNGVVQENLGGVKVVKAFMRMDYENNRFDEANNRLMEITIKATRLAAFILPVMLLIVNLSIVAIIWFGSIQVNTGNMEVGQVIAFINYMVQILFSLMMVAFMLMFASRAKASADRVIEVLETRSDIKDAEKQNLEKYITQGQIEFENVSYSYKDTSAVLSNISFFVNPGESVGIIGATGTGKSTLVNLIPRFYDATSGFIKIDGRDVKDIPIKDLRQGISMVLQEPMLFTGTIRDNIRWGKNEASEEEIIESAKMAQAHDFIIGFPDGYDTVLGQRGVNLSGGQKQRISIARALLRRPSILILDDSTSAVDMITEVYIQKALMEKLPNVTKFIIAQRISSIIDADKIIVLEDGQIASIGNHSELINTSAIYKDIYYSQLGREAI